MSPDLFSLYSQVVMNVLEDLKVISIGGRNMNNIRYADDTVLIADSERKLQLLRVSTLIKGQGEMEIHDR